MEQAKTILCDLISAMHNKVDSLFEKQPEEVKEQIQMLLSHAFKSVQDFSTGVNILGNFRLMYTAIGIDGAEPHFCTSSVDRLYKYYAADALKGLCPLIPQKAFKSQINALMQEVKAGKWKYIYIENGKKLSDDRQITENNDMCYTFMVFKIG